MAFITTTETKTDSTVPTESSTSSLTASDTTLATLNPITSGSFSSRGNVVQYEVVSQNSTLQ